MPPRVPPTLTLLGGQTMQVRQGEAFVEPGFTAVDSNRAVITNRVVVSGSVNVNTPGTYTLTYSVTDAGGTSTATRTVEVVFVDRTPPTITLSGSNPMRVEQGSQFTDPGVTARANNGDNITNRVVVSGAANVNIPGRYTLTYSVSDLIGNSSTATRSVDVIFIDRTPPTLTLHGGSSVQIMQFEAFIDPGFTAIDNTGTDITHMVTASQTVNSSVPGSYTVLYSVTDAAGNTSIATRSVTVTEVVIVVPDPPPEPEPEPGIIVDPEEPPLEPPDLEPEPEPLPEPDPEPIIKPMPPSLVLIGFAEVTIVAEDPYIENGYVAIDFLGNDITDRVLTSSNVNRWIPGLYSVTYTVTDDYGGSATSTRIVIVEPKPPPPPPRIPTITANGSAVIVLHQDGTPYREQRARAIDHDGTDISNLVQVSGPLSDGARPRAGNYTMTYTVTNSSGGRATTTRTVRVLSPTETIDRRPYSFNGQAKAGARVTHTNVVADAAGFMELRVTSIDKNMTIGVELINTANRQVALRDTFSAAGMKQYNIGSGRYELVVTVNQANGNSKYAVTLSMPAVTTRTFAEQEVPLAELPDAETPPDAIYHTVVSGESLWSISQKHFGTGLRWGEIYEANREVIGANPSAIKVGQMLAVLVE